MAGLLASCAETKLAVHGAKGLVDRDDASAARGEGRGEYKVGQPYQVDGVWYYPRKQPNYQATGIASWYGRPFHGRSTANGEIYDMNRLTAAHRTLPLPSDVRVTNLENGRSVVLRVNDRGPFVPGRIIDVSRYGARLLGFHKKGTAKVRVQIFGAGGQSFVLARPAISEVERNAVAAAPRQRVQVAALPPPAGITQAPPTPERQLPRPRGAATRRGGAAPPASDSELVTVLSVVPTEIYVQVGAFSVYQNANRLRAELSVLGQAKINHVLVEDRDLYRVRFGPIDSVDAADETLRQVIRIGHRGAEIVVE